MSPIIRPIHPKLAKVAAPTRNEKMYKIRLPTRRVLEKIARIRVAMRTNGEVNFRGPNPVTIRCCQYLNNVVEQDHRRVKGCLRPSLGFKTFYNARRVIIGIELAQKIHKRQFAIPIPWQSNPAVIWRHVMAA